MLTIQNPILKGFYPDPSICRVGEDYYLSKLQFFLFSGSAPVSQQRFGALGTGGKYSGQTRTVAIRRRRDFQRYFCPGDSVA